MRIINYAVYGALLALAVLVLGFFVLVRLNLVANPLPTNLTTSNLLTSLPKAYIVQSGSMSPAIRVGSLVIVQKQNIYNPNDVITFKNSPTDKNPTTHRIHFKNFPEGVGGPATYLTAGDANEDFDRNEVKENQIIGKVVFTLPYAGYVADFAKKPYGFILLVIVPATILIYEELKFLKKELAKLLANLKSRLKHLHLPFKGTSFKGSRTIISSINLLPHQEVRPLHSASILIPVIGAFLVLTSLSLAYFSDIEESLGNLFQAGTWGPQIAQTLVINEFLWNSSCTPQPEQKFWLELYNGSGDPVDIKDWQFKDDNNNIIQITNAQFFIQPGTYVLITKSSSTFSQQCYTNEGGVTVLNLGGTPDFTPSATGGVIKLEKPIGVNLFEVVDRIEYGPDQNSGVLDTGADESIARIPNAVDSALGDTFEDSDFQVVTDTTSGLSN